jgi:hypothetical protein
MGWIFGRSSLRDETEKRIDIHGTMGRVAARGLWRRFLAFPADECSVPGALEVSAPIPLTFGNFLEAIGHPQLLVCDELGSRCEFSDCNGEIALERDLAAYPILVRARALEIKFDDVDRETVLRDHGLARKERDYILLVGDGLCAALSPIRILVPPVFACFFLEGSYLLIVVGDLGFGPG